MNPCKLRLLEKRSQYEVRQIDTPELLSSDNLYAGRSCEEVRSPEESDELEFLPAT